MTDRETLAARIEAAATDWSTILHDAEETEFNRICGTEGWHLRNIPRISPHLWDEFLATLGEGQFHIQTMSTGNFRIVTDDNGKARSQPCDKWVRGYVLISPQGMNNLAAAAIRAGER